MKVKFVYDGRGSPDMEEADLIDMKTLPHVGDRIVLGDDLTYEIIRITHTPDQRNFGAVAMIRHLDGRS